MSRMQCDKGQRVPLSRGNGGGLRPRQEKFRVEFCVDLNGTQSAIRAGYARSGADVQAARLLANPNVRAKIDALLAASLAAAKLSIEKVDKQLSRICFSDIRNYYDAQGRLRPIKEWPPGAAAAIAAIETSERRVGGRKVTVVKLRLADKLAALGLACRRLGMLKDAVRADGKLTLETLVLESMKSAKGNER